MRFSKLVSNILNEMSAPWPDFSETANDNYLDKLTVPEDATVIKTISLSGEKYWVYEKRYKTTNTAVIYVVDKTEKVKLTLYFRIIPKFNSITIETVQKHPSSKFYYSDVIKKVILKRYDFTISDDYHTKSSFNLYKRLASDPEINMAVIDTRTNTETPIHSGKELDKYYGENLEHFRYKVSLK